MSEFYFDVSAWERDVEARKRAEKEEEESGVGGKRKRPSKKDLVSVLLSSFVSFGLPSLLIAISYVHDAA
jgi:hypothetical protein